MDEDDEGGPSTSGLSSIMVRLFMNFGEISDEMKEPDCWSLNRRTLNANSISFYGGIF